MYLLGITYQKHFNQNTKTPRKEPDRNQGEPKSHNQNTLQRCQEKERSEKEEKQYQRVKCQI